MMKVLVVSLLSATERRKFIKEQMERLSIPFEFFDALSPKDLDESLFLNRPKYLSKEAVATFETHRAVIKSVKGSSEPVLILEDDVTCHCDDVLTKIKNYLSVVPRYDMLFIGYMEKLGFGKREGTEKTPLGDLFYDIKNFIGFHSYIVNPVSVDKILMRIGEPNEHVDVRASELINRREIIGVFTKDKLFSQSGFPTQIPKKKDLVAESRKFNKIFQIGFNKCGTTSIHKFFKENGLSSIHWDRGYLARTIKSNVDAKRDILFGYDKWDCFTDMEDVSKDIFVYTQYFKELDRQYPNSKFMLNIRPVEKWLKSRENHGRGTYIEIYMKNWGMTHEEVIKRWMRGWNEHISTVKEYFKNRPNDLCVFDIETESDKFVEYMDSLMELKTKEFGQYNITTP